MKFQIAANTEYILYARGHAYAPKYFIGIEIFLTISQEI